MRYALLLLLLAGCENPFGYSACYEDKSYTCYKNGVCYPTGGSCKKVSEMK